MLVTDRGHTLLCRLLSSTMAYLSSVLAPVIVLICQHRCCTRLSRVSKEILFCGNICMVVNDACWLYTCCSSEVKNRPTHVYTSSSVFSPGFHGLINIHKHYVIVRACMRTPFYERCKVTAHGQHKYIHSFYTARSSPAWLG